MGKIYRHSVIFTNHYREPPEGLPRVLFSYQGEHHPPDKILRKINAIIDRLRARGIYGYDKAFDCYDNSPRKQWSNEAKFRNRKRRLLKRLEKQYSIPQLLEIAYQQAIAQKPEYYGEK